MTRTDALAARIVAALPMQRVFLGDALAALDARELDELERYLEHATEEGTDLDELAASYALIVEDTLREQIHFKRRGRYRHSRFEEVAASVYFEPSYMRRYMHGLALTAFLWPNHVALRRWFGGALAARRPRGGRYLEVGPGHGLFFATAMRSSVCDRYEGVDLSPTSVELTRRILQRGVFGSFDGWLVRQGDFLTEPLEGRYDVVVMGEVLEHVEEPGRFLARARDRLAPGGAIVLTTCANSPALDHIFLFRSADEVVSLVEGAGLRVVERLVLPYHQHTIEESIAERLPVNVALVATA